MFFPSSQKWRRRLDSNQRERFCRPSPIRSATPPHESEAGRSGTPGNSKNRGEPCRLTAPRSHQLSTSYGSNSKRNLFNPSKAKMRSKKRNPRSTRRLTAGSVLKVDDFLFPQISLRTPATTGPTHASTTTQIETIHEPAIFNLIEVVVSHPYLSNLLPLIN
jgi:hypothetical protein